MNEVKEYKLYTIEEVAKALSVSKSQIKDFRRRGMHYIKYGPRSIRYDMHKCREFSEAHAKNVANSRAPSPLEPISKTTRL